MLTRAKSRRLQNKLNMSSVNMNTESSDIIDSGSSSGEFPINNQLGEPGIFDEATLENVGVENTKGGGQTVTDNPATTVDTPVVDLQMLMTMIKQVHEQTQQTNKKLEEQKKHISQQITSSMNEIHAETQELIRQVRDETKEMIKSEVKGIKKTVENSLKELRTTMTRSDKELGDKIETVNRKVDDVTETWTAQLATHRESTSNEVKAANEENNAKLTQMNQMIADGVERQKKVEENITKRTEEVDNKLITLQKSQQELKAKVNNGSVRATTRLNQHEHANLSFNGEGRFPMEFLKELDEIQEEYYSERDTRWIGQYLEGDAAM